MARLASRSNPPPAAALLLLLAVACGAPAGDAAPDAAADAAPGEDPAAAARPRAEHPLDRLPAGPAGDAVRRAIDAHGGWPAWERQAAVDYRKTTRRFAADGSVAAEVVERHRYRLHPPLGMRIERRGGEPPVALLNRGDQAWKTLDGEVAEAQQDRDEAWNVTFGSPVGWRAPSGRRCRREGTTERGKSGGAERGLRFAKGRDPKARSPPAPPGGSDRQPLLRPTITKAARRFCHQQSSLGRVQTGRSFP